MSFVSSALSYVSDRATSLGQYTSSLMISAKDQVLTGAVSVKDHVSANKYKYLTVVAAAAIIAGTTYFLKSEVVMVRHRGQISVDLETNKISTIGISAAKHLSRALLGKPLSRVIDPHSLMIV